jgi:formyl-CoA transferase
VGDTQGPLSDVRVVEMGQLLAGPFCGQMFADFGAEVIKLEDPAKGDPMRQWGQEKPHGLSLWWPVVARGKKSVTCNLRTEEGQALARELIATADVVIENFRPGTLEKWGLGYEQLSELNPGLVMIRVSGFGQTGPYSKRAGYGSIGEAMGGLRYVTGDPSSAPSRTGISIGDSLAGLFAALGGLIALHARGTHGRGQVVDSAIYEAVLAMMESLVPEYTIAGYQRERTGSILPNVAPSNLYPTSDGEFILIAANQDSVFQRLAGAMGMPELITHERFATHSARGAHHVELDQLISDWAASLSAEELLKRLEDAAVPAGRIYRAQDMLVDPHFAARQALVTMVDPRLGEFTLQNVVPRLSGTPGEIRWLGPELGQHNEDVYGTLLDLDQDRRDDLAARGVI